MAAARKAAPPSDDEDDKKEAGPEGEGGEGVDLPKKKISGKKLVIIAALLVVLIGGGAALYFAGVIGGSHEEAAAEGEHGEGEGEEGEATGPVFYDLPQILVNLRSTGRRPAFLKLKVRLQLKSEEDRGAVTSAMPRVIDSFQLYLRELTRDEMQGTAGLERLREELRIRVSAAVAPVEVKDVLFTEMIFGE